MNSFRVITKFIVINMQQTKYQLVAFIACFVSMFNLSAQNNTSLIPYLTKKGNTTQLVVDGKPFLMIAGELHNSSSSTVGYMQPIWKELKDCHLNTVLAALAWEQFEPQEGIFDFMLLDSMIKNAEENGLKLVLLWFGTWKNGESSYVPVWMKKDTKRFFRVKSKEGKNIETISPFCEEARKADAKAMRALMKHLAEFDKNHTVIMVQPENEVGVFQEIDFCSQALEAFKKDQVPERLITYLKKNKLLLKEDIKNAWQQNGQKNKGTWIEVFGDTPYTKEFFMAWQYATYINEVAKAGKEEHPLPMFVNAWIIQHPGQLPGQYPNGGPVSRVMDIYKAGAESIDILSPDIYLPDFKQVVSEYMRADNPLLVPESKYEPGRAFYAFAQCDALCFSIFAIDDMTDRVLLSRTHEVLEELQPLILRYQGTGNMKGFLRYKNEKEITLSFKGYNFRIVYEKNDDPAYGFIIQTGKDDFLVAGLNARAYVSSVNPDKTAYLLQIWEGDYKQGEWVPRRLLNGDETFHNSTLFISGRWEQKTRVPAMYKVGVYTRE